MSQEFWRNVKQPISFEHAADLVAEYEHRLRRSIRRVRMLVDVARKREAELARTLDVVRQRSRFPHGGGAWKAAHARELRRLAARAWLLAAIELLYIVRA